MPSSNLVNALLQRHRELDYEIRALSTRPGVDASDLRLLKIKKLHLKEKIEQLQAGSGATAH
ncbi:DUF465 domain-containing protein [Alsobacter soli]|nr:YdcH family protein [Alsobacter soli]